MQRKVIRKALQVCREILFRVAKSLQVRCRLGLVLKPLELEFDYHHTCSTFSQPCFFLLSSPTLAFLEAKWRLLRQFQPRHKSPAARRSEESRKSTVFVSSRAHSRAGELRAEQSSEHGREEEAQSRGAQGRAELRAQSRAQERKPVITGSRRNRSGSRI